MANTENVTRTTERPETPETPEVNELQEIVDFWAQYHDSSDIKAMDFDKEKALYLYAASIFFEEERLFVLFVLAEANYDVNAADALMHRFASLTRVAEYLELKFVGTDDILSLLSVIDDQSFMEAKDACKTE